MRRFLAALALLALSYGCQRAVTGPPTQLTRTPGPGQCAVNIQVTGMTCDVECPPMIYTALDRQEGVLEVFVDFKRKRAGVLATGAACDDAAVQTFTDAIVGEGFEARILEVTRGG